MLAKDAQKILTKKFGKGGKFRATMGPKENTDFIDYSIERYRVITIHFSPLDGVPKVTKIHLHALSRHGKGDDKSFNVNEININNL